MTTIYYTKRFTSGILKGLRSNVQSVSYPSVEQCHKTIFAGKKGKDCMTKTRWIIEDCSFQNYQR